MPLFAAPLFTDACLRSNEPCAAAAGGKIEVAFGWQGLANFDLGARARVIPGACARLAHAPGYTWRSRRRMRQVTVKLFIGQYTGRTQFLHKPSGGLTPLY